MNKAVLANGQDLARPEIQIGIEKVNEMAPRKQETQASLAS